MKIIIHFVNSKPEAQKHFDSCPREHDLVQIDSIPYRVVRVYYTEHRSDESAMTTNIVVDTR